MTIIVCMTTKTSDSIKRFMDLLTKIMKAAAVASVFLLLVAIGFAAYKQLSQDRSPANYIQ